MERCLFCQAELTRSSPFCLHCGHAQPQAATGAPAVPAVVQVLPTKRCVACGEALSAPARFCKQCGREQPTLTPLRLPAAQAEQAAMKRCQVCAEAVPGWARFCGRCGQPFSPAADILPGGGMVAERSLGSAAPSGALPPPGLSSGSVPWSASSPAAPQGAVAAVPGTPAGPQAKEGEQRVAPGDFIGPYRVLAEMSRLAFSVTYLVEHPAKGRAAPAFLTIWPEIHLCSSEEERAFAQACQEIKGGQATAFPLLESGVEQEAPYILLSEHEASQEGIALLDQRLQQRMDSTAPAVSLEAAPAPSKPPVFASPSGVPPTRRKGIRIRRRTWVGGLAALGVILVCLSVLYLVVPASGATLTLIPSSKHIQQSLHVVVFTQANQRGDIQGHLISSTTPTQTQTGQATGTVHHDATTASGNVVISHISLTDPNSSQDIGSSTIASNGGVNIVLQEFTATQGATLTVPAQAEQAGSRGNIPAYDIDFPIELCLISDILCNAPLGQGYAQNPSPFTGGQDAFDQSVVQQSDINAVTTALISQLTQNAQAGLAQLIMQQVQPGEQTALPTPQCTPSVQADHHANDVATQVTVSGTVTCYQIAYAQQDFLPGVLHAQQQQVNAAYGPGYGLVGELLADPPVFQSTDATQGTATLLVKAQSIWAYQVSAALKARIAQQIVGQAPSDAKTFLLHTYAGIQDVTVVLQGFGSKLPRDARAMRVAVQAVVGLHA